MKKRAGGHRASPRRQKSTTRPHRTVRRACCQAAEKQFAEFLRSLGDTVRQQRLRRLTIAVLSSMSKTQAAIVQLLYLTLQPLKPQEVAELFGLTVVQVNHAGKHFRELMCDASRMERRIRNAA
jgi:hypothetical protein